MSLLVPDDEDDLDEDAPLSQKRAELQSSSALLDLSQQSSQVAPLTHHTCVYK